VQSWKILLNTWMYLNAVISKGTMLKDIYVNRSIRLCRNVINLIFLKWLRNAVLNNILQVHESLRPSNTKQTNSMCSFFGLFWFCCQYLQSDWLDSLLWGSITMARGSSPESPGRRVYMIFLVYCIASLFNCILCLSCFPALHNIFHTTMPRCSLFVLKVA